MSTFRYFIHLLSSTVNKILVYEIGKALHFVFLNILHSVPSFLEPGVYVHIWLCSVD